MSGSQPVTPSVRIWLAWLAAALLFTVISFAWLDLPLARIAARYFGQSPALGQGLGSPVLLAGEAALILALAVRRLTSGRLPDHLAALGIASLTSICTYAVNENVLKRIFGIATPAIVRAHPGLHVLHLWAGTPESSFPSGHMALAGGFAGVLMGLYPKTRPALTTLLALAAAALVLGAWHFLSDVLAGSAAGLSAGFLASALWRVHLNAGASRCDKALDGR